MKRAWLVIPAAVALWSAAVVVVADRPRLAPERLARDFARPFVLPALWNEIDAAERRGDLVAVAALGRDLLRYLPDWTDGQIHFAARLAFDLGSRAASTAAALASLDAGVGWLQEAREAARDPTRAARLAAAQALFVEARCDADPELAAALHTRSGRAPSEIALRYLDDAIALAPANRTLRERRAFLLVQVVAAAIRTGDMARAVATLDGAIELLGQVRDPEASMAWVSALRRVRPVLTGEQTSLERVREDPYLEDLLRALDRR